MKSRLDILEELDIKCGQLEQCRSLLRHTVGKTFQIMVKIVRPCLFAVILYTTIVNFSNCDGLDKQIKTLVYNNNGLGTYSFEFESADGTFRKEDGGIVLNSKGVHGLVVRGEYGFKDPEGRHFLVRYIADANGYQPQSNDDDIRFNDRRIV